MSSSSVFCLWSASLVSSVGSVRNLGQALIDEKSYLGDLQHIGPTRAESLNIADPGSRVKIETRRRRMSGRHIELRTRRIATLVLSLSNFCLVCLSFNLCSLVFSVSTLLPSPPVRQSSPIVGFLYQCCPFLRPLRGIMPLNTLSVSAACAPSIVETYFSHYFQRGRDKTNANISLSYQEGLELIRRFLEFSSKHTVEDLQAFTGQYVPTPYWVFRVDAEVVPPFLDRAASVLHRQLGYQGLLQIGGKTWWQWRGPDCPLGSEWLEMRKDHNERKRLGEKCERCILYVHGGAYYFGSVDEHRYQLQRHARKMKARVLAPRYRLAPQFPFPCGLQDCLATYFYLLEHFKPTEIVFAGDSAGGGMILTMLVMLRDQNLPLPSGTILLSPWVDLTHSFPSVTEDGDGDYIPPHGFIHKPSMAWPPPVSENTSNSGEPGRGPGDAVELPAIIDGADSSDEADRNGDATGHQSGQSKQKTSSRSLPKAFLNNSVTIDGDDVELKEQVQLYTTNSLLAHPLVSPIMQPTLGGLPPMLIQVGGAERLRDEQIYLAHKAANPLAYLPSEGTLSAHDPHRTSINRHGPTEVYLQVWENLCHVPHTLSFARSAKYMYRSVAQFGDWAFARAQRKPTLQADDEAISMSDDPEDRDGAQTPIKPAASIWRRKVKTKAVPEGAIGKVGDPLPSFQDHMIRHRLDKHGMIFNMPPEAEIPALSLDPEAIGRIKPGPVKRWMTAKTASDLRFANDVKKVAKKRAAEVAGGYEEVPGERPPPTALVGRRKRGVALERRPRGKSIGLAMWSGWGSTHDERVLEREENNAKAAEAERKVGQISSSASLAPSQRFSKRFSPKARRMSRSSLISSGSVPVFDQAEALEEYPMHYKGRKDTRNALATSSTSAPSLPSRPTTATSVSELQDVSPDEKPTFDPPVRRSPLADVVQSHSPDQSSSAMVTSGNETTVPTTAEDIPTCREMDGSKTAKSLLEGESTSPLTLSSPQGDADINPATLHSLPRPSDAQRQVNDVPSISVARSMTDEANSGEPSSTGETLHADEMKSRSRELQSAEPDDYSVSPMVSPVGSDKECWPLSPSQSAQEQPSTSVVDKGGNEVKKPNVQCPSPLTQSERESVVFREQSQPFASNRIFEHRTSLLGSLGADGMPTAHHDFLAKPSTAPTTSRRPSEDKKSGPSASRAATSTASESESRTSYTSSLPFTRTTASETSSSWPLLGTPDEIPASAAPDAPPPPPPNDAKPKLKIDRNKTQQSPSPGMESVSISLKATGSG